MYIDLEQLQVGDLIKTKSGESYIVSNKKNIKQGRYSYQLKVTCDTLGIKNKTIEYTRDGYFYSSKISSGYDITEVVTRKKLVIPSNMSFGEF